ncbi:uncharacterized protein LOC124811383 isoform X2 [Hydra vulgaris]|uniref:Uncharacterized protein LOC124811383 isoform X2 n=1 Tax=Hydra vulgaris TaxID=6087 RepID=A0ABM4CKH4_HYDVU
MQKKLEKSIIEEGVVLEEEEHTIIEETYEKYGEENPFTEDSPQALLWQQQKIQAGLKDRRSMRWHPLIIRWCISLYLKSPSAYRHICSTPFLNLPCKNTVQKYINFTDPGCGFNKDVMYNLTKKIDLPNIKEHQRYVSIIVDEMKIKSGLAFSSSTGKLVGFSESGSINELLLNFENKYTENKGKSNVEDPTDIPLASYVTVLMVRGITSSLKYVFGHFASAGGLSSSQLYFTIWDVVRQLESVGLKVMAIVADGASPNRKFMRLHSWKSEENTKDGVIYWTWNECCPDRKMFFICDVPHLIKTTRNNLEKSHENSSSRSLMIDGQPLVWDQIIRLYDWDLGIDRDAVGLTMGHKLSEEHINLNSRTRMRVNLAVQVLSSTVADMLEEQGLHSKKSLIKFIRMIDKFFDCLNVSKNFNYSRKPDLDRYKAIDDVRFDWLQNTFLTFINNWEEQCQNIPDLSQAEKNRFCLSKQTLEGLRITVNSFTTLGKFLLVEGAEYILSEKFCQDPLEEYFGKQRMRLGSNDNPLLIEFNSNALGLNVAGDNLIRVFGSNTKGRKDEFQKLDVKNTDLPLSKK